MRKKISFKVKTTLGLYEVLCYVDTRKREFEIDVYVGRVDGYAGKEDWIDGWEEVPYKNTTDPIEKAREIIEAWERPIRLERYLKMKRGIIELKDENKQEKPKPVPVVSDYRDVEYQNMIAGLLENPGELDYMDKKEREQLLKANPELRIRYYELKALDQARSG